jgi:hypothetical protein
VILEALYDLPATLGAALLIGATVAVSLLVLFVAQRLIPHPLRRSHNDVAGFLIAIVGVIYAVLLGFIAVAVWEDYNAADAIVQREASLAGDIYLDAVNMRGKMGDPLRKLVREYLDAVIDEEFPAMLHGEWSPRVSQLLERMHSAVFAYRFRGPVFSDVLAHVNSLDDERRDRLINANSGLQSVAWFVLLAGSGLTVIFCTLFGVPDVRVHAAMTGLVAASIALVLFLIVSFDYPFRGANRISSAAFEEVRSSVEHHEAALARGEERAPPSAPGAPVGSPTPGD